MKAFKIVRDPAAFELMADETRRHIVYLLRAKEMTVSQIAAELDLTPQAIYHHIRKLRDADLVEVAREERVDHFIETYYRASAEVFNFSYGEGGGREIESHIREALQSLHKVGFRVTADEATIAKFTDLYKRLEKVGADPALVDQIAELDDVDFITRQDLAHIAKLVAMSDKEFAEYLKLYADCRKLLLSLASKSKTVAA